VDDQTSHQKREQSAKNCPFLLNYGVHNA